jgi:hypothetical protein
VLAAYCALEEWNKWSDLREQPKEQMQYGIAGVIHIAAIFSFFVGVWMLVHSRTN